MHIYMYIYMHNMYMHIIIHAYIYVYLYMYIYIYAHRPLDLFTVISGFTTHLAYGSHEKSLGAPLHFLARRSSRLVFLHICILIYNLLLY